MPKGMYLHGKSSFLRKHYSGFSAKGN